MRACMKMSHLNFFTCQRVKTRPMQMNLLKQQSEIHIPWILVPTGSFSSTLFTGIKNLAGPMVHIISDLPMVTHKQYTPTELDFCASKRTSFEVPPKTMCMCHKRLKGIIYPGLHYILLCELIKMQLNCVSLYQLCVCKTLQLSMTSK